MTVYIEPPNQEESPIKFQDQKADTREETISARFQFPLISNTKDKQRPRRAFLA